MLVTSGSVAGGDSVTSDQQWRRFVNNPLNLGPLSARLPQFTSLLKNTHGKYTFRTLLRLEKTTHSLLWMWYVIHMYANIGDGAFLFTDLDSISQTHGWLALHVDCMHTKFEGATTLARSNVPNPKIVSSRFLSTTTTTNGQEDAQNRTFHSMKSCPRTNTWGNWVACIEEKGG